MAADLPVPTADPDEVREAAREILARPEFLPEPKSLQERVIGWIGDRFADLISALAGGGRGGVIAIAVIVLAAAVGAWVAARFVRSVRVDRRVRTVVEDDDVGRSSRQWSQEADAHEARGEWREAVRCRYRALVAELTGRNLVEEVPGRTSGEYRRLVAEALPDGAAPFAAASDVFDRAWYGHRVGGAEDAAAVREASDRVLQVA